MKRYKALELSIVVVAAAVTAARLACLIAGVAEPSLIVAGTGVGLLELTMVVLVGVSVVLVLAIYRSKREALPSAPAGQLANPQIMQFLFSDKGSASLWTVVRLYLGSVWLIAGYPKLLDPGWMVNGVALKRFWVVATTVSSGGEYPQVAYDWYHNVLRFMLENGWYTWFAKVIAIGEVTVGICLVLGAFVGFAALFGAGLNFNYALAGSAGTNAVLLALGSALITAWMVAGYIGLDRFLLPHLGTPWRRRRARRPQVGTTNRPHPGPQAQSGA